MRDWASRAAFAGIGGVYTRYLVASGGALCVDLCAFFALLSGGVDAGIAAGLGYATGLLFHWCASSRLVFTQRVAPPGSAQRRRQKLMFIASALLGLGLTMSIVKAGHALGIEAGIAKLVAIAVSFQAVWLLRRLYVFAR